MHCFPHFTDGGADVRKNITCRRTHSLECLNCCNKNIFVIAKPLPVIKSDLKDSRRNPAVASISTLSFPPLSPPPRPRPRLCLLDSSSGPEGILGSPGEHLGGGLGRALSVSVTAEGSPPSPAQAARPGHGPDPRGDTVAA